MKNSKDLQPLTLATLRKEAGKKGATVEHRHIGKWHNCNVDAPAGKLWACASIHSLVLEWQDGQLAWRNGAIADALDRMAYGLADCDDPDCDFCHSEE